jgi:hypothetical protein
MCVVIHFALVRTTCHPTATFHHTTHTTEGGLHQPQCSSISVTDSPITGENENPLEAFKRALMLILTIAISSKDFSQRLTIQFSPVTNYSQVVQDLYDRTPQTSVHTHTQYRRPTVKEHDHHWDSHQDFNELKYFINFKRSILTVLSPSVTQYMTICIQYTWKHFHWSVGRFPMMAIFGPNL